MQNGKKKKNCYNCNKKIWVGPNFGESVGQQQTNLFLVLALWWPCLYTDRNDMSNLISCFLPSFSLFGKAFSEKIFLN